MPKKPRSLSGKVVLITGGARGIGRSTAAALVAEGAHVVIADLDPVLTDRAANELGGGTVAKQLDVTDHEAFTAVLDDIEATVGPLDVLINNAGVMSVRPFVDDTFDSAYRQFAVNVFALMHGTREAIKRMQPRHTGHVVNVSSMGGVIAMPGAAAYCSSKHAVVGFCEALRWELVDSGIDLTYVLPALVNTELAADVKRTRASNVIEPEQDVASGDRRGAEDAEAGGVRAELLARPGDALRRADAGQAGRQADDGLRAPITCLFDSAGRSRDERPTKLGWRRRLRPPTSPSESDLHSHSGPLPIARPPDLHIRRHEDRGARR